MNEIIKALHRRKSVRVFTDKEISAADREAILEELRLTRRRGYSTDNCEMDPNVRCVGVPVYNAAGKLVGGLSASGPESTMSDEKMLECVHILWDAVARMRERIYH